LSLVTCHLSLVTCHWLAQRLNLFANCDFKICCNAVIYTLTLMLVYIFTPSEKKDAY